MNAATAPTSRNRSLRKSIRVTAIAVAIGGLLALMGWGMLRWRDARRIDEVAQLQRELFADDSPVDATVRKTKLDGLLAAIDQLDDAQKMRLGERMFEEGRQRMTEKARDYLKLPENKKLGYITAEFLKMRARGEEFRAIGEKLNVGQGPPGFARPPAGGWQNMSKEDRDAMRRGMLDRTTPEERAVWNAVMEDMNKYRGALGIPGFGARS